MPTTVAENVLLHSSLVLEVLWKHGQRLEVLLLPKEAEEVSLFPAIAEPILSPVYRTT